MDLELERFKGLVDVDWLGGEFVVCDICRRFMR